MDPLRNQSEFLNEIRRPIRFKNRVGPSQNNLESNAPINFDPSIFESVEYAPTERVNN